MPLMEGFMFAGGPTLTHSDEIRAKSDQVTHTVNSTDLSIALINSLY